MPETNSQSAVGSQPTPSFVTRVKPYWREIGLIVFLAALMAGLLGYLQEQKKKSEELAWNDIMVALHTSQTEGTPESKEELLSVIKKHKAADATFYAYMKQIADAYAGKTEDDWRKGLDAAQTFLKRFPTHYFANQVRLDMAITQMRLKDYEAARRTIASIKDGSAPYLEGEIHLAKAQCLDALDMNEEAAQEYRSIQRIGQAQQWPPHVIENATLALAVIDNKISSSIDKANSEAVILPAAPGGKEATVAPLPSEETKADPKSAQPAKETE